MSILGTLGRVAKDSAQSLAERYVVLDAERRIVRLTRAGVDLLITTLPQTSGVEQVELADDFLSLRLKAAAGFRLRADVSIVTVTRGARVLVNATLAESIAITHDSRALTVVANALIALCGLPSFISPAGVTLNESAIVAETGGMAPAASAAPQGWRSVGAQCSRRFRRSAVTRGGHGRRHACGRRRDGSTAQTLNELSAGAGRRRGPCLRYASCPRRCRDDAAAAAAAADPSRR